MPWSPITLTGTVPVRQTTGETLRVGKVEMTLISVLLKNFIKILIEDYPTIPTHTSPPESGPSSPKSITLVGASPSLGESTLA